MVFVLVLASIFVGLAVGAGVAVLVVRSQRAEQALDHAYQAAQHEAQQRADHEAEVAAQQALQQQAVDAAVQSALQQVLHEREATASATARAVTADREATIAAAVENAVKVAGATLDAKLKEGSTELGLRTTSFNDQVQTINTALGQVQGLLGELQKEKAQQHGQLVSQLKNTASHTRDLHDTTAALREVLASPKARGQWGERMAEDVLSAAGFIEGINYRKQLTLPGGGVPDFTFLLPRGLHLNMDVKFPIDNYMRFLEAEDDLQRDRARTAFARDVRARIKELRDRGYIDPETTVDTLLLFIPNESVYAFVHENDSDLIDVALKQKVVMCSPLTLFSVLAIVRQSVDNFRLERRSSDILDFLVEFQHEWTKFTEHLDKTSRQLDTFNKSFESLGGTRRNVLERKLRRVDELQDEALSKADLLALPDVAPAKDEAQTAAVEPGSEQRQSTTQRLGSVELPGTVANASDAEVPSDNQLELPEAEAS